MTNEQHMPHGLLPRQVGILRQILAPYAQAITRVDLFGSRSGGRYRNNSDIDLVIHGDLLEKDIDRLHTLFQESALPFSVDVKSYALTQYAPLKQHMDMAQCTLFTKDDLVLHDAENEALQEHVQQCGKTISGWLVTTLGAVTKWLSGGTPPKDRQEYWGGGIPWISANSMHSTYIEKSELTLTNEGLQAGSRLVPKDTVLLLVRGSALHNRIPIGITVCSVAFNQDVKALIPHAEVLNERYLLYWLMANSNYLLDSVVEYTGIGAGKLDTKRMCNLSLHLPPIAIQKNIAAFFHSLDDRIQLLRETNATLEAMAQALFKSWFVDFDPVHAKAGGRTPEGMDAETAALFPAEFEESELGMIPKGWKYALLSEAYEINPRRKLQKNSSAKYLDMSSVGIQGHLVANVIMRPVGSGSKFQNGDTLLARITPCLENGKTAFVDFLEDGETAWGSTEFVVLRPKMPLPEYHGYLLTRYPVFRSFAIQSMSGTSGRQRIQNDALANFQIAIPTVLVCKAFEKIVALIQKKITASHEQARTLTAIRDTLLPRLISGKLRLPEFAEIPNAQA